MRLVWVQKLLELYKYESTRDPAHFSDAVYNANAHVLLHDDPCYRFESCDADGTLTIQMLDPDRTEVAPGGRLFKFQSEFRIEMRTVDFLFCFPTAAVRCSCSGTHPASSFCKCLCNWGLHRKRHLANCI
jgi:hypothetical protein